MKGRREREREREREKEEESLLGDAAEFYMPPQSITWCMLEEGVGTLPDEPPPKKNKKFNTDCRETPMRKSDQSLPPSSLPSVLR